jgi:hypothetical protein
MPGEMLSDACSVLAATRLMFGFFCSLAPPCLPANVSMSRARRVLSSLAGLAAFGDIVPSVNMLGYCRHSELSASLAASGWRWTIGTDSKPKSELRRTVASRNSPDAGSILIYLM